MTHIRRIASSSSHADGTSRTTAAMVGAMAGTRFGFAAIPSNWNRDLHARDAFDDRVDGLVERAPGWQPDTALVELETGWCRLYESPEGVARWEEEERQRKLRREQRRQLRPASPPPPPKMRVEEVVIDGAWMMNETGRAGGPWLGASLRAVRERYDAGAISTLDDVRALVATSE